MSQTNININTGADNTNRSHNAGRGRRGREGLAAEAAAVAEIITERQLINIDLKEK